MKKIVVIVVVVAVIITYLTGIVSIVPTDDNGNSLYGLPFAWKIVSAGDDPQTRYDVVCFTVDVIIWCIVAFVLLYPKGAPNPKVSIRPPIS
jgi:hypothetical protein